jgi:hypothetical protein
MRKSKGRRDSRVKVSGLMRLGLLLFEVVVDVVESVTFLLLELEGGEDS